jgi:hypothetical protein
MTAYARIDFNFAVRSRQGINLMSHRLMATPAVFFNHSLVIGMYLHVVGKITRRECE